MKKLLLLTLASSILFSDISIAAQFQQSQISEQNSNTLIAKRRYGGCRGTGCRGGKIPSTSTGVYQTTPSSDGYDAYMKVGYNAYEKGDYNTALINFRRALVSRPNDVYATRAIQNTEKSLART